MRIWMSFRRFRRYRQIMNVLIRNGFGSLVESLKFRKIYRKGKQEKIEYLSPRAKRLRLVLEELGPTFIKLGQMLSTRADIVPQDIFQELQKLQDQVPPASSEEIILEIEIQLKSPISETFIEFDKIPVAAASIGQVHKAKLKNGEKVVVKVQRPNVRRIIEEDIDILRSIAVLAERHIQEAEVYGPVEFIDEFAKYIRNELDYTLEARNMERFAHIFADDKTIYIPKLYWEFTTGKVLTMEMIDGIKINQIDELRKQGYDPKRIAYKGAEAYLKQIFIHRFFHGDPHPGNIFVLPGEVIGFMDFGIMGRLSPTMASRLNDLLIAIIQKDADKITEHLLKISKSITEVDVESLKADVAEFIDKYYGMSLKQFQISEMVREINEVSSRHRIRIDRQLSLLGRVLAEIEGLGRQLDPDFNVVPLIEPFARKLILHKNSPKEILNRTSKIVKDYTDIMTSLPRDFQTAIDKAKSGKLRIEFKHIGLEEIDSAIERSTSRLAFAIIVAALVISSALIMHLKPAMGPTVFGIPIIGASGYFIAAISGIWLLITIIRNKTLKL
ncbi:MAG: ABC1 kinase family protein [bacterium]